MDSEHPYILNLEWRGEEFEVNGVEYRMLTVGGVLIIQRWVPNSDDMTIGRWVRCSIPNENKDVESYASNVSKYTGSHA